MALPKFLAGILASMLAKGSEPAAAAGVAAVPAMPTSAVEEAAAVQLADAS